MLWKPLFIRLSEHQKRLVLIWGVKFRFFALLSACFLFYRLGNINCTRLLFGQYKLHLFIVWAIKIAPVYCLGNKNCPNARLFSPVLMVLMTVLVLVSITLTLLLPQLAT